ncbi:MAG TPA: hypothetical protein VNF50_11390 [Acidimicrobiales bacterium]|nr:hypothetical protein [Acidimicrobiales bacterium]
MRKVFLALSFLPDPSIREAIDSAGAGAAFDRAGGLDGVLGLRYAPGAELSVGQWQPVSLGRAAARCFCWGLVLDEPTAALDPETERDLWSRYTSQSAASASRGGITMIVSDPPPDGLAWPSSPPVYIG